MNERIQQLAEQAREYATTRHPVSNIILSVNSDLFEQKFAELIVQECAEQIIAKGTDWVDFAPSQTGVRPEYWDMAQQIKEHFGVEE